MAWASSPAKAALSERHAAAVKYDGLTCRVERFGWSLRSRCGRFVCKMLSFSNCPAPVSDSLRRRLQVAKSYWLQTRGAWCSS